MAQFHDDDDDDDSSYHSASKRTGRGQQRPASRNVPSRGGAGGSPDITGTALLIGGLVLVAGIGGMAAFRMAGLNESSSGETVNADPPVAESPGNALKVDNEPDDTIRIPEIEMPEDGGDLANAGKPKPRTRPRIISSTEVTQHYLDRIARLDRTYNSYITVTSDIALQQAAAADQRLAPGNAPALCGVPIAHKDIFCTTGVRTSCASKMLDKFIAPYNATIVENYLHSGVVMLGKTNMDEFAMGSSNETSWYGPVKNPWAIDCVPGGSSGGSAAAVAAHLAPAATASASVRPPVWCQGSGPPGH